MVARQSHGPTSPSLTHEEVSAYLEREFRLLRLAANDLCPHCPWLSGDVFSVMVIEYIECARRLRSFNPARVKNLWSFIRRPVTVTALRYLEKEKRRGFTIGPGRTKGGGTVTPTYCSRSLDRLKSRAT